MSYSFYGVGFGVGAAVALGLYTYAHSNTEKESDAIEPKSFVGGTEEKPLSEIYPQNKPGSLIFHFGQDLDESDTTEPKSFAGGTEEKPLSEIYPQNRPGSLSFHFGQDLDESETIEVVSDHLPFNQIPICDKVTSDTESYPKLYNVKIKYNGLCELICNYVLVNDLLGKGENKSFLVNKIKVDVLSEEKIRNSHILDVHNVFWKVIAYIFGIFPNNLLSISDQWKLVTHNKGENPKINRKLFSNALNSLEDNEIVKVEVFSKLGMTYEGHALLIKKVADNNFIYFDPNAGEYRNLSLDTLMDKVEVPFSKFNCSNIVLIKGEDFLKELN